MELPALLRAEIEQRLHDYDESTLLKDAQAISRRYRENDEGGGRLLTMDGEALAYAASRMPATYAAASRVLAHAAARLGGAPAAIMDVGAGTGAVAWAAAQLGVGAITCLEREPAMQRLGKGLSQALPAHCQWADFDINCGALPGRAPWVTCAYMLGEVAQSRQLQALEALWAAAQEALIIIEPGTPGGYARLARARAHLQQAGAYTAAPCPHQHPCPMDSHDWCHFTTRVARSRIHRTLKGGEAPYEDEKYTYMVFSRRELPTGPARILRHPMIGKGHITLHCCTANRGLETITLSKRDGPAYKAARKLGAGDELPGK